MDTHNKANHEAISNHKQIFQNIEQGALGSIQVQDPNMCLDTQEGHFLRVEYSTSERDKNILQCQSVATYGIMVAIYRPLHLVHKPDEL